MKTDYFSLMVVYVLINLYLIIRSNSFLKKFEWAKKGIRICILAMYVVLASLPVFGAFLPENMGLYTFQKYGNIFLGFLAYYAMIFVIGEIVLLFLRKNKQRYNKAAKRVLCAAFVGTLLINTYGLHQREEI